MAPEHDLFSYPSSPGFKEETTSKDAAESMIPTVHMLRAKVLARLRAVPAGLTADECATSIGESVLSIRPRFTELKLEGVIVETGERRANASKRKAKVWRLK